MQRSEQLAAGETEVGKLILPTPKTEHDYQLWLDLRTTGLGASEASAMLGMNPNCTPLTLWLQKRGLKPGPDETEEMWFGKVMEPVVDAWFRKETGLETYESGLWRSKLHDWMLATPDRGIIGRNALAEYKTTSVKQEHKWANGQTPDEAELQAQQQMAATGADMVYVVVFIRSSFELRFELRLIYRDQTVIDHIIRGGGDLWHKITNDIRPAISDEEEASDISLAWPVLEGEKKELDEEHRHLFKAYQTAKENEREAAKDAKTALNQLKEFLAGAELPTIDGTPVARLREITQKRPDTKWLARNYPNIHAKALRETSHQRFDILKIK